MAKTKHMPIDPPAQPDDAPAPSYLKEPMYLATVSHREITDLAYQLNRLADHYDFKKGVEARLVTQLLKMAGHALDQVRYSDLVEVEKANPGE